jgi:myo-inositol-1(or 4)-monophosphatase
MAPLKAEELDEIYAFAIELGKQAGKILLDAAKLRYGLNASREVQHVEKLNAVDLVTQTDEGMSIEAVPNTVNGAEQRSN